MRQRWNKVKALKKAAKEEMWQLKLAWVADDVLKKFYHLTQYNDLAHKHNLTKFFWQRRLEYMNPDFKNKKALT